MLPRLSTFLLATVLLGMCGCQYVQELQAPAPSPTAVAPLGPRMYVTDREKGAFAVSTSGGGDPVLFPVAGGAGEVAVASDRLTVYATSPTADHLMIFTANGEPQGRISVGKNPFGLVLSPDGKLAYVANQDSNDISVIDLASRKEKARIPTGKKPYDLALSPDGSRLWVTLHEDGQVAAIDTAAGKEVKRVPVGISLYRLCADSEGVNLYVAAFDNDEVVVLSGADLSTVAHVKTDEGPYAVACGKDGRIFATNIEGGTVSVFHRDDWTKVQSFEVGPRPYGIALSPDGGQLYVALEGDSRVSVRSPETLEELQSVTLGTSPAEVYAGP